MMKGLKRFGVGTPSNPIPPAPPPPPQGQPANRIGVHSYGARIPNPPKRKTQPALPHHLLLPQAPKTPPPTRKTVVMRDGVEATLRGTRHPTS